MKFDCDRRFDKLMRDIKAQKKWHRYFAVWPRRISKNDCRFFETIERRMVESPFASEFYPPDSPYLYNYEYRAVKKAVA